MFLTVDQFNPWDPATWSSNPLGLYTDLRNNGLIVDTIHLGEIKYANLLGYALSTLTWPHLPHKTRVELTRRVTRRRVLGIVAKAKIGRIAHKLTKDTRILTCSSGVIDLSRCRLPIWHYSDACLGVALRENPAYRGLDPRLAQRMLKQETANYAKLDRLLLFSQWAANSATTDHALPATRVAVVGHGPCIPDPGTHERMVDQPDVPTILFVCTDWERKGGPLVLESFKLLRQNIPDARLVVIGYLDPALVEGVPGIEFVGAIRKNIPSELARFIEWYRKSDLLVLASTYDPMPNITLEANLCGTPVVTTNVSAVEEQMNDGVNGYMARNDPVDFEAKMRSIISERDSLRKSSRSYVLNHFMWSTVVNNIKKHL